MSSKDEFRGRKVLLLVGLTIALVALATGCGGGGGSSSSSTGGGAATEAATEGSEEGKEAAGGGSAGLEEAEEIVAEHEKPPAKIGVKTPIKKGVPKGKTMVFVNCGAEACSNTGKGMEAGAEAIGWTIETINAEPVPQVLQNAMEEAVRRKPDFIAITGSNAEEYPRQLEEAEAANIPVIVGHALQKNGEEGVTADVLPVSVAETHMETLAAKTAVDLGGEGTVLVDYLTGFPLPQNYTDAYVAALEKFCPECTIEKQNIQPTAIGKDAPQQICNYLRANPADAVALSYDAIGVGIQAACKSAGTEAPPIYSYSPDAAGVEELKNEEKKAGAPQDYGDEGAAIVDAAIRIGNGEPIDEVEGAVLDMDIWTEEYGTLPEDPSELTYLVPGGLEQWEELWGVK